MNKIFGLENIEKRKEAYEVIREDILEEADVCVIGSGAAGAIIASKLARNGLSVVLLEKGGYYDAEDMNQREADMIPLLWKNNGAIFTDDLRIVIVQGECLGGSTVINDAVCFATPKIIRDEWRRLGVNISDDEWDKAIDEVWRSINVSKVTYEELNKNNLLLKKGCELKGYKGSENYRNCKECMQCGFCHLGCHYETKQDMLVTYIRAALHEPNARIKIYCNCTAEEITHSNGIVDGINGKFIDKLNNVRFNIRVNAKVVVISAGAIASSLLLMKNGIAISKAGKGLSLHPAGHLIAKFDEEINAHQGIPMSYTCHEFGVTNGRYGGFLIEGIFLPIFQFAMGLPTFLVEHAKMMEDLKYYAMAGVLVRDQSNGNIELVNGKAKIHYEISELDLKTASEGLSRLAEIWFDLGAKEVITEHIDMPRLKSKEDIPIFVDTILKNPKGINFASAHPQGGNRMGEDSSTCVVDSHCKVHDFNNLFVCDASVFPTSVGVNPQITIMALAVMTADHILNNWSSFSSINKKRLAKVCTLEQTMYCSKDRLEMLFNTEKGKGIEKIVNSGSWSFDEESMMIYNDKHWRGFFPQDASHNIIRYFGGFWKRFYREDNTIKGITHAYEPNIDAPNIAELRDDLILLKYTSPEYSIFYDLLKMVSDDVILGKAFIGLPPHGIHILTFSMCRRYSIEFMSEDDHETIYQSAKVPEEDALIGRWNGRLVSDSILTPVTHTFTFKKGDKLSMEYLFANLLRGESSIEITKKELKLYDFTNWNDEVRMVNEKFMIGKYCSPSFDIKLEHLPSFLDIEEINGRKRLVLRYILEKSIY